MTDILDTIDATMDGRCACGCGTPLPANGPSGWFVDADHQRTYQHRGATDPDDVYRHPNAALYPRDDSQEVPLRERPEPRRPPRLGDVLMMPAGLDVYWPLASARSTVTRLPTPDPPINVDLAEQHRLENEDGWHSARTGPVAWRPRCATCGASRHPSVGWHTRTSYLGTHAQDTTYAIIPRNLCPACTAVFPGPLLVAQWQWRESTQQYEIRLSAPGWTSITAMISRTLPDEPRFVSIAWAELERETLRHLTYRDVCALGCGETGRMYCEAERPVRFDIGDGTFGHFQGRIWLCARHFAALRRAIDPITGIPLLGPSVPG